MGHRISHSQNFSLEYSPQDLPCFLESSLFPRTKREGTALFFFVLVSRLGCWKKPTYAISEPLGFLLYFSRSPTFPPTVPPSQLSGCFSASCLSSTLFYLSQGLHPLSTLLSAAIEIYSLLPLRLFFSKL